MINSDKFELWQKHVIIAYSDETIREIGRAEYLAERFLNNMEKFKTVRIYQKFNNFIPTGIHVCKFEKPRQRFDEMRKENLFASFEIQGLGILHKVFGGQKDKSIEDITKAQKTDLKKSLEEDLLRAGIIPEDVISITQCLDGFFDRHKPITSAMVRNLEQALASKGQNTPLLDIRNALQIDSEALNAIEGQNILERIWELIIGSTASLRDVDMGAFFGFEGNNPITNKPLTTPDKVGNIMLILNMLGYAADKKLHETKKFVSSTSDNIHAQYGCLCTAIVSNDRRFQKRLYAAFQYLNIDSAIYSVDHSNHFNLSKYCN